MSRSPLRREGTAAVALGASPMVLFLLLPIAALLFSLRPRALAGLDSPFALRALWVTLRTTAAATILCVSGGLPLAYLLARFEFRGKQFLDTLTNLPITLPPVVAGVALLLAFGRRGLIGKYFDLAGIHISFTGVAVVLAQVFIACPFFIKAARAGFESVNPRLESAARTLGATPWRVFWTVTVPLSAPSLLAGTVMAWARALSEFGATMMFAGNFPGRTQTLSLAVMTAMESDLDTAVAVSTLSLILALAALAAARYFSPRHD
jgi:molybdate transport system permease protein